MIDRRQHWETVYGNKAVDEVSWFQPHAAASLRLIEGCADKNAHIIDVGGGALVLVDGLLDAGYRNLTVLDLAEPALAASRARLGARAQSVRWIAADITRAGRALRRLARPRGVSFPDRSDRPCALCRKA